MPLSTLGLVGGPLTATALLTPAALPFWTAILQAVGTFLVTNTLVMPGTMVASGTTVSGAGKFQVGGSSSSLGATLAAAAGSPPTDAKALLFWTSIANDIITDMNTNAKANPTAFVASPTGGPVTGTGTISFATPTLGVLIPPSIACTDPPGIAGWLQVGNILELQIAALGQVLATPIGFVSPNGGGALTGSGTIV